MTFAAPLVLLALAPWAALAWWMLRGRAEAAAVPFLGLWPRQASVTTRRPARRVPPAFVAWALAAILLAILASSRPEWTAAGAGATRALVVIDRGATTSAQAGHTTRLVAFLHESREWLDQIDPTELRLIPPLPPGARSTGRTWIDAVIAAPPTAADTASDMASAAAAAIGEAQDEAGVLVITDRADITAQGDRLLIAGPAGAVVNAAIGGMSVEDGRVLVLVRNRGPAVSATLVVTPVMDEESAAASEPQRQELDLPADGTAAAVVDVPTGADALRATLERAGDQWPGDDTHVLAREHAWPRVIADPALPPPIRRLAAVYGELRPPRPYSRDVRITANEEVADVIVASASEPIPEGEWTIADHPIALGIDWARLADVHAAAFPFGADTAWQPIVRRGERVLVAVRPDAPRRVWIGFEADDLPQSPDFVRFWADVLAWVNEGGERWAAHPLRPPELAALSLQEALTRIGVERGADGRPIARVLAPDEFPTSRLLDRAALERWLAQHRRGVPLAPWLLTAALACALVAGLLWPRRNMNARQTVSQGLSEPPDAA